MPLFLGVGALVFFIAEIFVGGPWFPVFAVIMLAQAAIFLHTTARGKFHVWAGLLDDLALTGDESLLDLGCGRGAVLVAAAQRLPRGTAVGIDLWRSRDQSGNSPELAMANAKAMGVADRVQLDTGDMTALPYPDGRFDVVTSALAVHNIPTAEGRETAIREALRVVRPGGRLVLVDFRHVDDYRKSLDGQRDVRVHKLGPSYWYGGPWAATSALLATKA